MKRVIVKGVEEPSSILFRLREDGQTVYRRIDFNNYVYVKKEDYTYIEFIIKDYVKETEYITDPLGEEFVKIILKNNFHRQLLVKSAQSTGTEVFEADVNAVKRFMTSNDLQWQEMEELKVGYFDLETDDRVPLEKDFKGRVIAKSQILSCAIGPQKGNSDDIVYYCTDNPDDETNESEIELLKKIFDELSKYDVISAWNAEGFDIPYLKQRQKSLGLDDYFNWGFINWLDDLVVFKNFYDRKFKSYSLNNIGEQFVDKGKIVFTGNQADDISEGQGKFYRLFKEKPDLFEKYNKQDVELMQLIEQKAKNYMPKLTVTKLAQAFIQDSMFNSELGDLLYLRKCHLNGFVAKSRPSFQEKEDRKLMTNPGGGYTFCYEPGLNWNVEAYDYKSHYPLIMITFNISPETFAGVYKVDFEEVAEFLSNEELKLLHFSLSIKHKHLNKKGSLKASYDKEIDKYIKENELDFDLIDIMFKFTENYKGKKAKEYAYNNGYIWTPADFNRDTNGWTLHPHRLYHRKKGMFPLISEELLEARDKIKYKLKTKTDEDSNFIGSDEFNSLHYYQTGVKIIGNSLFGILGAIHTRFYNYEVVDTVTTIGRWIMKKSIIYAWKRKLKVVGGDTDSIFTVFNAETDEERVKFIKTLNDEYYELYKDLFKDFNTIYTRESKNPYTKELEKLNFFCVFEHEHTYPGMISVAKKRYYYLEVSRDKHGNSKQWVETRGGAFLKRDTNPLAAKLQKELCEDLLTKNYDRKKWVNRLLELKNKCFNQQLETEYLIFSKKYTKHHEEFGQVMIDNETNMPKKDKDGNIRHAPIPVHIRMVKRLESEGKEEFNVGDTIEYIIAEPIIERKLVKYKNGKVKEKIIKPSKQEAISVKEFEEEKVRYDADTYWRRITTPIVEILNVTDKEQLFRDYLNCWNMTDKEIEKEVKKLEEEEDDS